ncbi:MAG: dTDP-4-dehydrorhamnose reductase [Patescibacteria group bacterium]
MPFLDFSQGTGYTEFAMKILILGAQGNLGTQLVLTFKDHEVLAWDRNEVNLLDSENLIVKLDEAQPDLVINAAAYNAVDKCESLEEEKELAIKLNTELPSQLATWCHDNHKVLVQYSTDYVFSGNEDKKEFNEADVPNPINVYGQTKADGELTVINSGADYYLIRVSKLFGPSGASEYSKKSFFDIMLDLASRNPELSVVDEELSCFTYTPDLAAATKELITDKKPFGIYHLINEGAVTWYEAVLELKKIAGFEAVVKPVSGDFLNRPAKRPLFSVLQNTKVQHLRSYREALQEYLKNKK